MSQIIKTLTSGGPIPPVIPTSFVTQDGTAVPAANILLVDGFDSTENNDNGIITKGGVVGTGTANEVDIVLTNRATGQVTTTDTTLTSIITFPLTTGTVYSFAGYVTGRSTSTGDGCTFFFDASFKSIAGVAIEIGTEYPTEFVDPSLELTAIDFADIFVVPSGNNVIVQVRGAGTLTINWDAKFEYRQVS